MHWQQTNKINKEKMVRYLNVRWSPCTLGCPGTSFRGGKVGAT